MIFLLPGLSLGKWLQMAQDIFSEKFGKSIFLPLPLHQFFYFTYQERQRVMAL